MIDEARVAAAGTRNFVLRFGAGMVRDANGDGVVHVTASNVTLECQGVLFGDVRETPPDKFSGTAVRISGAKNVTVRYLTAMGFKVGLRATEADGLVVDGGSFHDLWRMHLKSTAEKEHNDDWLWPHENDKQEWVTNYGAAVCVEKSAGVRVSGVTARACQNGLILDRVSSAAVFDNDLSFLSGWGIAMWRSSNNMITRNALDFCIRGYSHGKYNRGQDSAGLLMFEQCSGNEIRNNSITHCGDGVFVFAGKEALGEKPVAGLEYMDRGCNSNQFEGNDLSFSAAHGLELTFSFDNNVWSNRIEGNGICGLWGGYSQRTLVWGNTFTDNGQKGASEGGGINIEHGYMNEVKHNLFTRNSVAVKLWDDDDGALLKTPWALANHHGCISNSIKDNQVYQASGPAFVLRGAKQTCVEGNTAIVEGVKAPTVEADDASGAVEGAESWSQPRNRGCMVFDAGASNPVGARDRWRGREWIVVGEWGPVEPIGGAVVGPAGRGVNLALTGR